MPRMSETTLVQFRELENQIKNISMDCNLSRKSLEFSAFRLAYKLYELSKNEEALEEATGLSFKEWCARNLVTWRGKKRSWDSVKSMMSKFRRLLGHPPLMEIMHAQQPGDEHVISLASAYECARLSEIENWPAKVNGMLSQEKMDQDERNLKKNTILKRMYWDVCKLSRNEIVNLISESQQGGEELSWPKHGGKLDPDVLSDWYEVLDTLCDLRPSDDRKPQEMSYVQEVETVTVWMKECLDALRAVTRGNNLPLKSLLNDIIRLDAEEEVNE